LRALAGPRGCVKICLASFFDFPRGYLDFHPFTKISLNWFASCIHEPMSGSRVKDEMKSCAKGVAAPDLVRYAGALTIEVHH
jgi:hypothetical protein